MIDVVTEGSVVDQAVLVLIFVKNLLDLAFGESEVQGTEAGAEL